MEVKIGQRWQYKSHYQFVIEIRSVEPQTLCAEVLSMTQGPKFHTVGETEVWSVQDLKNGPQSGWHYLEGQDKPE